MHFMPSLCIAVPTLAYMFNGNAIASGSYVNTLTTFGTPTFTSSFSRAGEAAVFLSNPTSASSASVNYYTVTTGYSYNAPLTLVAWLRCDLSYYMTVIGLRGTTVGQCAIQIDVNTNGQLGAGFAAPSVWTITLTTPVGAIVANQWFHVAVTISSSMVCRLYLNGISSTAGIGINTLTFYEVLVVGSSGDATKGYNGYMDRVQMFNMVLSSSSVLAMVQGGK